MRKVLADYPVLHLANICNYRKIEAENRYLINLILRYKYSIMRLAETMWMKIFSVIMNTGPHFKHALHSARATIACDGEARYHISCFYFRQVK